MFLLTHLKLQALSNHRMLHGPSWELQHERDGRDHSGHRVVTRFGGPTFHGKLPSMSGRLHNRRQVQKRLPMTNGVSNHIVAFCGPFHDRKPYRHSLAEARQNRTRLKIDASVGPLFWNISPCLILLSLSSRVYSRRNGSGGCTG